MKKKNKFKYIFYENFYKIFKLNWFVFLLLFNLVFFPKVFMKYILNFGSFAINALYI